MTETASSLPRPVEHAQQSDLGMRRGNNQDALTTVITDDPHTWQTRGHLLLVADGMGAHAAGELASKLAVDNIPLAYYKSSDPSPAVALRHAIRSANEIINNKGQNSIDFQGMGTTCTCLAIAPQGVLIGHVGDSRAYRLRGDTLEQLSFDHSLIWEAAATGHLPEESLKNILPKNVITRSLGPHPTVNVDLEGPFSVRDGDVYLVCSDGLSGQVTDEELGAVLMCLSPNEAVHTLIDLANLRGGPDNISVAVAKVLPHVTDPDRSGPCKSPETPVASLRDTPAVAWLGMIVCLLLLLGSLAIHWPLAAVLSAAGLGASIAIAFIHRLMPPPSDTIAPLAGPFGNGPYRKYDCRPGKAVSDSFAELSDQLRGLSDQDDWPADIDWKVTEQHREEAARAAARQDYTTAVTEYCHAIRLTMKQLRERQSNVTTQSGINLQ